MIELLEIHDFLDGETLAALRAELGAAGGADAKVTGSRPEASVESMVRRTTRLAVPAETRERVRGLLVARKGEIAAHFGVELGECEEPQFLRYRTGDYFVAHQDGNTPLVHDDTRFRRVSTVLFLSAPSEEPAPDTYGGGSLVFHGPFTGPVIRHRVAPSPGTLVAFRSETTHEVTPVTHGERYTIAAWFR